MRPSGKTTARRHSSKRQPLDTVGKSVVQMGKPVPLLQSCKGKVMRPTGKSANRQVSLQKAQDEGSREESSQRAQAVVSPFTFRAQGDRCAANSSLQSLLSI